MARAPKRGWYAGRQYGPHEDSCRREHSDADEMAPHAALVIVLARKFEEIFLDTTVRAAVIQAPAVRLDLGANEIVVGVEQSDGGDRDGLILGPTVPVG